MSGFYSNQVSSDLIWEVTRNQNAFLVKRNTGGGVQFSRDPFNLANVHSRKHAGFVNQKAVGIHSAGEKGGVTLITKRTGQPQRPGKATISTTLGGNKSTRKTYASIVGSTAKTGYRPDIRAAAVARASAIRRSQLPVKEAPASKLRGVKAKKAAAAKEA
ncbi:hypothetical protein B7463_g10657, partial [Scytalidium lignicola]